MLNPMPDQLIHFHENMSDINLDGFFGFCKVEITKPKGLIYPLLPYRKDGLINHPTGKFTGIYFSEELKAIKAQGYKVKLIEGYEFYKTFLFESFINDFYAQKKNSIGAERFIAKMHLNTLYGYFGRSLNLLETIIVKNNKLNDFTLNHKIKNLYQINDDYSCVLTNKDFNVNNFIKSKVAIASAVTAYARIEMLKIKVYCLKNNIKLFYSDTDSIFIDKPLPSKMIGIFLSSSSLFKKRFFLFAIFNQKINLETKIKGILLK
jgi:hypothetical protein